MVMESRSKILVVDVNGFMSERHGGRLLVGPLEQRPVGDVLTETGQVPRAVELRTSLPVDALIDEPRQVLCETRAVPKAGSRRHRGR